MPASLDDTDEDANPTDFVDAKGGLYGGAFDSSGLDANVRAVLMDFRWATTPDGSSAATTITYFFPQAVTDYTNVAGGYTASNQAATFEPVTDIQQDAVLIAFNLVASYTNLTFVQASSGRASDATFRFAQYGGSGSESDFPTNNGPYAPSDARNAADTWLGSNGNPPAVFFGTDDFNTIIHEMGHAFGLKHGHDDSYNGALAQDVNDNEFSVMTYASYLGSDTVTGATAAREGSAPQRFMMYDIAALQAYYGANFSKVSTTATYTWDPTTGQQMINGVAAPNTGTTATGKIFSTVWTQGATATYDLSNFNGNQVDDLRPGQWLTFSQAQLADLNSQAAAGTPQFQAQGNVYNALLYDGDMRSAVSNLFTGSGNDRITGNDLGNILRTNGGNDTIDAGGGNDVVSGGAGADTIDLGTGIDTVRDHLADLNSDMIFDFGLAATVDIEGSLIGRDYLSVTQFGGTTAIGAGDLSFGLNGLFSGGEFMSVARGSGASAHTEVTFVSFLPSLLEGVRVDATEVNGIANDPFLTGDGSIRYTLDFKTAVSTNSNTLGFYRVAADGTILDVGIAFADTLNVGGARTVNLGTPGNGEHIGFFLIQDGFDRYGNLPDDLFFAAAGTSTTANANAAAPPVLTSASLGTLDAAPIFHSLANLNPDGAIQVLSGVAPGGQELQIGFEDLPTATGDNDFQDLVIGVRTTHNDILIL